MMTMSSDFDYFCQLITKNILINTDFFIIVIF